MTTYSDQEVLSSGTLPAKRGGCHELEFSGEHVVTAKIPVLPLQLTYTLPSGARISAHAFARGDGKAVARCYLPESGEWKWEAKNSLGKGVASGLIHVRTSDLPGKLRVSLQDNRQFQYDNGTAFLHLGDVAEALLSPDQDNWAAYINQAAQAGFTKIRVRLGESEDSVSNFYGPNRKQLNLAFWDEVEKRLLFALGRFPKIQFQLNLFAQDREELEKFEEGDILSHLLVSYVCERFSPLANVHWSLASEIDPAKDSAVTLQALSKLGKTIYEQAPWHSLITCGQPRFANFLFNGEKWCGMTSLSSLGQVHGEVVTANAPLSSKPIVLDQDRSEYELAPLVPRYYFRRLFWGMILSGGHPSYHGLDTSGKGSGHKSGIVGYYDACHAARLHSGAHDLLHIRTFLSETCGDLNGWVSDDSIAGNKPLLAKAMRSSDSDSCIIYVANPDSHEGHSGKNGSGFYSDQNASASDIFTTFNLELPFDNGSAKWFNPRTGEWNGSVEISKASTIFLTPEPEDWVLWVQKS
ncbi:DUF4038 domain-containing protein [Pelagicoccus albus]|uniref:DUF4038 domain-containing protein n=1 Tax=Pelagicoccus albus TaxID=415222 RepID=A0A7X1B791_9BACT|nr:DUF4038 domain-containing protein [Pelagicoccus albus]MBC2606827.1 DUF4038 domain-containing protein [Pelagicoccus albus]